MLFIFLRNVVLQMTFMQKIMCFILICIGSHLDMHSQSTVIPDSDFEQALIDLSIDSNGLNGNILNSDAVNITVLSIYNRGINDLTGIEAFIDLKYLYANDNQINTINLLQNVALEFIDLENNDITTIDLSNNQLLLNLYISNNFLNSLDVSHNEDLQMLGCNLNYINSLDLTQNLDLKTLWCYENNLSSLNLTNNLDLEVLTCSNNSITSIDLSSNLGLNTVSLDNNGLNNLSIEDNVNLTYLSCNGNNLSNLNLDTNVLLDRVLCLNNNLTSIDVTMLPNLFLFYGQNNSLSSIDLSQNPNLKHFRAEDNSLESIDFRNNNNGIVSDFNVTQNPNLSCIYVDNTASSYLNDWDIDMSTNFVANEEECSTLGIEENISLGFNMYPVPAIDNVFVTVNNESSNLKLYTITGKLVKEKILNFGKNTIQLSSLSAGMYLLSINSNGMTETKKLIIK